MNDQNEVRLQSARWAIQTVQCIVVSFKILTIQAVKFVEFSRYMSLLKFINTKMSMISQHHDCSESHINITMFRNNYD